VVLRALLALFAGAASLAACAGPAERFERGEVVIHRISLAAGLALQTNAFLLEGPRGRLLIDAGTEGSSTELVNTLVRLGLRGGGDLDLLVLTHGHPDHAGGAKAVREAFGPFVAAHPGDLPWLEAGQAPPPPVHGFEGQLANLLVDREAGFPPVRADIQLFEGQDLSPFGVPARVVHLPGHTLGSVAVVLDDKDAFLGDIFQADDDADKESHNAAHAHPFGHDPEADRASAQRLLCTGVERFFAGHGGASDDEQVAHWLAR
jgi:hydroxyacylglutathione hydrolase